MSNHVYDERREGGLERQNIPLDTLPLQTEAEQLLYCAKEPVSTRYTSLNENWIFLINEEPSTH